ncbi:protein of unknown function (plasmid) [Rhodovastum atsumiense]|nr:protein of unknown function [Rhodovastum atsumiense]
MVCIANLRMRPHGGQTFRRSIPMEGDGRGRPAHDGAHVGIRSILADLGLSQRQAAAAVGVFLRSMAGSATARWQRHHVAAAPAAAATPGSAGGQGNASRPRLHHQDVRATSRVR